MKLSLDKPRIYLAVSNDLEGDQRIHRHALTLIEMGAEPVLLGRKLPGSTRQEGLPYRTHRFRMIFRRGFLFYVALNIRLFFHLLRVRTRIIVSNDLDTLPGTWLAARFRRRTLVYDSHEFFTEVPELINRPFVRKCWLIIERSILPKLRHCITVSEAVAKAYRERYGIGMQVVRNLSLSESNESRRPDQLACGPIRIIIYQGSVNMGRGLEHMIVAMKYLEKFRFLIYGQGPLQPALLRLRDSLALEERVQFMGRIPFSELRKHTRQASLGISLEEDMGLNYRYALPNKLFDYIHARVPVLVSDLPEMRRIVTAYEIGEILEGREPEQMAAQVRRMMDTEESRMRWKKNLRKAARDLNWEQESEKLKAVFLAAGLEPKPRSHGK